MPYYLYNRNSNGHYINYTYKGEDVSIAGCNNGIIAQELQKIIKKEHLPNLGWNLPISKKYNSQNKALIVDLNPKGGESSIAEIDTVFGFSYDLWSPIMLRLKLLTYWDKKIDIDENNFNIKIDQSLDVVYTMLYLRGSFKDGRLNGTWNLPGPSSTNGLLWFPEASSYFIQMMQTYDPESLKHSYKAIH